MKKLRRKKLAIAFFLLVFSLMMLPVIITSVRIVQYGRADEKTRCDAAIVLGAATTDGEVSPVYRERIHHGIWLLENGYADCLILTGGIGEGNEISDARAAKQYALEKGVPGQAIHIEEQSTITEENLEYAKAIMDTHAMDTAIIVSDPLHMKRAMKMAKDYGITAYSSPTPTTMYRSIKTQLPFLAREVFFYIGYSVVRTCECYIIPEVTVMDQLLFDILFWGVFVGGGTVFLIFCLIMAIRQYKRDSAKKKEASGKKDTATVEPEFTTVTKKATVVDQNCCVKMIGMRTPKTVKEFIVIFQTENGEILKFIVPEEMYDGFEKGQSGILTVVDGALYGFELDASNA